MPFMYSYLLHYGPVESYGLNQSLQDNLAQEFQPLGIVAFSNCCRSGCSGAYNEDNPGFEYRNKGIYFIRLHLNGINYDPHPKSCYAYFEDFDYLMVNWDSERDILVHWCGILGLIEGEFTITKPESSQTGKGIKISFIRPLSLQDPFENMCLDFNKLPVAQTKLNDEICGSS